MTTQQKHYAVFVSPGTFFSETTTKSVERWDPKLTAPLARDIVERYGARPFGFHFETRIEADDVSDDRGGFLRVEPKLIQSSGMFFMGGRVLTWDEVVGKAGSTLASNMRSNDWPLCFQTTIGYRATQPYTEKDCIVDGEGNIIDRGDDPGRIVYRQCIIAQWKAEFEAKYGRRA